MKVTLIEYTGKGRSPRAAAELMVFTKSTRLKMNPGLLQNIKAMTDDEINAELDYMAKTIPSSWEMVDYTFLIEGVTRAFTHQFVRTRNGSYAQQTMRILDVAGFSWSTGPSIEVNPDRKAIYDQHMIDTNRVYQELIAAGASIEDARGVLPTNINTNIVAKFNLRTLSEMISKRSSSRTQGEYRDVIDGMADAILAVHPWAWRFIANRKLEAASELEDVVRSLPISKDEKISLIKSIDILRS